MQKYYSWIPTVSGRLSYSFIGQTRFPQKCIHINKIGDSQGGQAIFLQERYCDDFVLPFLGRFDSLRASIFRCISRFSRSGQTTAHHYFVAVIDCVKDTDKTLDRLTGRVFPILATRIGLPIGEKIKNEILHIIKLPKDRSEKAISEFIDSLDRQAAGVSPTVVSFEIRRDGITTLWPSDSHPVPDLFQVSPDDVSDYVEQCFFFLRDISHVHQHHGASTDTIVRVHKSEQDYAKRIYFDLFRYIIKFKRIKSADNIMNASGILAYAKSFRSIVGENAGVPADYQVENLKMSIDSAQFKLDHASQTTSNKIALTFTTIFAIFGALVSVVSLVQYLPAKKQEEQIHPSESLIKLTSFIAENPTETFIYTSIIGVVVLVAFGQISPNRFSWFEDIQRLWQHRSKEGFVLSVVIIGIALICLGVIFLRSTLS